MKEYTTNPTKRIYHLMNVFFGWKHKRVLDAPIRDILSCSLALLLQPSSPMQTSPPEQHWHAKDVLAETVQVHSFESLRWAAMHAEDLGEFLKSIPYVSLQIVSQGSANLPSDSLLKIKELIDWDTLRCTPFRRKLEYLFDPSRRDPSESFDHRLCMTSAGVNAQNVPLSFLHATDRGRRHLWLGMIKAERKATALHMTVGFYQVDVTDLPSLLHMKEEVQWAQQQQYKAELCQEKTTDHGLRHRKPTEP
jgi:hypothetical protein